MHAICRRVSHTGEDSFVQRVPKPDYKKSLIMLPGRRIMSREYVCVAMIKDAA